ncbi:MAG: flagellar biosynthesis protein FlhA [Elusimicrobiales bacterium]|nr:flagellar biosynthesis protein FlhA [Elusimicrobiales bacterium]
MINKIKEIINFSNIKFSELLTAFVIIFVVFLLIIPIPNLIIDMLFISIIAFSITVFFISFIISQSMDFSSFPTILLISSFGRLIITVVATKRILMDGSCGKIVESIGNMFLGDNAIIGIVVFAIIITIQYLVIIGGITRISEVSARFTLDAMPGKQMSIDADLNAGLITEEEAKRRRKIIEEEADFYGSMDGASKFVRGDTIASIIVIIIIFIGGTLLGVIKYGLGVYESFEKYATIAIGVGLLTQISSLLTSVAAGILVTRATSGADLATEVASQIFIKKEVLWIAAIVSFFMIFIPSTPKIVLITFSLIMVFVSLYINGGKNKEIEEENKESKNQIFEPLEEDVILLEIGLGLIGIANEGEENLYTKIENLRKNISKELGFKIPYIVLKESHLISTNSYSIKIFGIELAKGIIQPSSLLAINAGNAKMVEGRKEDSLDPVFMLPSIWIKKDEKFIFEKNGYTVVSPQSIIITHLSEILKKYSYELLTRQTVSEIVDEVKKKYPGTIDDTIPSVLSIGEVHRALQNLLRENIPLKNIRFILEAFCDQSKISKDPISLSEAARKVLARYITEKNLNTEGILEIYTFSPKLEEIISSNVKKTEQGYFISLSPSEITKIADKIAEVAKDRLPEPVVIACSSSIRYAVKKMFEKVLSSVCFMSYDEISSDVKIKVLEQIDV